ncbi:LacI family DNA-binding transcriptional regulator [Brachybacterium sp. DNPG3]
MARVTLADVARRAGVSSAAVSHVLNGTGSGRIRVSAATRELVARAAEELQYVPSAAGRGLARGSSGRIAIVIPNLFQPYFARMAEALILALEERGLSTTMRLTEDAASEREAVLGRSTEGADGVIVCPHFLTPELLAGESPRVPVVQVGGGPMDGIDCVVMGELDGALDAVRHLIDRGRRSIAYLAEPWLDVERSQRYLAYRQALDEAGLEVDPRRVVRGSDWDRRESGMEAMVGLLRTGVEVDAVMCVNDAVAVGALRAASLAGLRIPEDVAFAGFDNTEEAAFTTPPLTSVDPGVQQMASLAVEMLADRLAGASGPDRRATAATSLVIRESTGI